MGGSLRDDAKSVLLVDDDASVRNIFASILQGEGYHVTAVKNGYEAIQAVDQDDFSLALVDLRMPGLDGMQVLERIREGQPQIRVIVYSGFGSIEDESEAMRKGAIDYLTKPLSAHELKARVKKGLENDAD